MCGISGLVDCGDRETLARMTSIQSHRGPDDAGLWDRRFPDGSYMGLGSRRLAIIDLSPAGHMPMCNEDHSIWITYNGEIYNHHVLRCELESKGHVFASNTDTEVIIHLYEEEGLDCVRRLNGMFAFGLCDLRSGKPLLFMARDHFGVKPFYYATQGKEFAFASEAKALLQVPGIKAEIDPESLHQYLTFLWVPDSRTMFRGIHKLPAGHYAIFRDGQLSLTKYWDLTFPPANHEFSRSEDDLAAEIRERFESSVDQQLVSDVPVGAFLSAGLDSSSIVAMMQLRRRQQATKTYTVTFPKKYCIGESTLDDPGVPARLAHRLGCENQQIVIEPDVVDLLPRLTWHMDEPTADPAIIPAYLVCREARKQSTVLLSGVGGDELFAGYRKHAAHSWAQMYQKTPITLRRLTEAVVKSLPNMRGSFLKGSVRLAKKMARGGSLSAAEQFVMNCTYLDAQQKLSLYGPAMQEKVGCFDPASCHWSGFNQVQRCGFPESDVVCGYEDIHDELESHVQRQNEHGVIGRSASAVSRSRVRGICRVERTA